MSRGKNLQEMETGTKQSKTAVNANAKAAEPMQHLTTGIPPGQTGSWEDLGGPTPENYKSDDDSSKLKTPESTLKQVKDVVNKGAKAAEAMQKMSSSVKESLGEDDEEDDEEDEDDDEVVSEEKKKNKNKKDDEDDEDDEDEDDEEDCENQMKEAFEKIEEEIEEDVNALLSGEDLSEEFKQKAKTVFESALNARTQQIEKVIIQQYNEMLEEQLQEITEEFEERVDSYLEYVSNEWIQENSLQIEDGVKTELTESFLVGMKNLFENHYVEIPDDKYDVLSAMTDKLDEMETKLNEQILKNVAMNRRLAESVTEIIFSEVSEGLAISQKEKLASLAENVEFDSEKDYHEKLVILRESYFPRYSATHKNNSDYITEDVDYSQPISGTMSNYLDALGRVSKK